MEHFVDSSTCAGAKRKRDDNEIANVDLKRKRNDDFTKAMDLAPPCEDFYCEVDFVICPEPAKCPKTRCADVDCPHDDRIPCESDPELTPPMNTEMFSNLGTYSGSHDSTNWSLFPDSFTPDFDVNMTSNDAQYPTSYDHSSNFNSHMQTDQHVLTDYDQLLTSHGISNADLKAADIRQLASDLQNAIANGSASLPTASSSRSEEMIVEEKIFECMWLVDKEESICGQIFDDAETLHKHFRAEHRTHAKEGKDDHRCYWKDCWAKDKTGLQRESSGTSSKLDRHVLKHTDWHEFVCKDCGKTTATADQLKKHTRTHTGDAPHACTWFGPNVEKNEAYDGTVHGISGEQCPKKFKTGSELATHMDVHRRQQSHECTYCHKMFTDASNLSKHKKTHQKAQYKCTGCDQTFRRIDHWKRHQEYYDHMPSIYRRSDRYESVEKMKECEREFEKWKKEVHTYWARAAEGEKLLPKSEWHSNKRKPEEPIEEVYFAEDEF